jgi:CRP-like cAMP-binding protein
LTEQPRAATATALTPCSLLSIDGGAFARGDVLDDPLARAAGQQGDGADD